MKLDFSKNCRTSTTDKFSFTNAVHLYQEFLSPVTFHTLETHVVRQGGVNSLACTRVVTKWTWRILSECSCCYIYETFYLVFCVHVLIALYFRRLVTTIIVSDATRRANIMIRNAKLALNCRVCVWFHLFNHQLQQLWKYIWYGNINQY